MFSCFKKKSSSNEKIEQLTKKERSELFTYLNREQCDIIETLNTTIDRMKTCITIHEKNLKELKNKEASPLECSICMNNKINVALVPCGHTYCDDCICTSSFCYKCRSPIISRIKLYFN